MPLYEFQCADCQDDFEELVRSSTAAAEVQCPRCGSRHVQRKISLFAAKSAGAASLATAAPAASCSPGGT